MPLPSSILSNDSIVSGGGGGGVTLDGAYDFGGPGAGRTIIADAGAVEVLGPFRCGFEGNIAFPFATNVEAYCKDSFTTPLAASEIQGLFGTSLTINPTGPSGSPSGWFNTRWATTISGVNTIDTIFVNSDVTLLDGTNTITGIIYGHESFLYNFGTPTVGSLIGLDSYTESDDGIVGNLVGFLSETVMYGGTVTNMIGAHIVNFVFGGLLTNNYGLKVKDVAGAVNNWAIHTGMGLVEFGDDTIVNGKLTVTGAIDPVSVFLSDPAAGTALFYESNDGQTAPVSGAATGRLRYNNVTGTWQQSVQGGAYTDFAASVVASSQTVMGIIFQTGYSTKPRVSNVGHARQYLWVASKESGAAGFTTISSMNSITTGQVGFIWSLYQDADGIGTKLVPLSFAATKQSGMRVNVASQLVYGQLRHNWYLSVRIKLPGTLTGHVNFSGLATAPRPFPGTGTKEYFPVAVDANANFCGVRFCDGENGGKWAVYVQSGGAAGTIIDTGVVAVVSTLYDIEIWSDSATGKVYASINGSAPVAVAAGLPASTQIMTDIMMAYGDILTGGGATADNDPILYSGYYEQD